MPHPIRTVTELVAAFSGNDTVELTNAKSGRKFGGPGIEAGGRIQLGTATTAEVAVTDANGRVLHSAAAAVTTDTDIAPVPMGVKAPLTATVTNADGSLEVFWSVKK